MIRWNEQFGRIKAADDAAFILSATTFTDRFMKNLLITAILFACSAISVGGQGSGSVTTEKLSVRLASQLKAADSAKPVARAERERALTKMMEGQGYIWRASRVRSQRELAEIATRAQAAYVAALSADPTLAEAYTALAEIHLAAGTGEVAMEEALALAELGLKVDGDNFGSRRLLGRLYAFKSGLGRTELVEPFAARSIENWTAVTRLDPRNAEGWAVLSLFHEKLDKKDDEIGALQSWISAAPPADSQFFTRLFGPKIELTPEAASIRLGGAYIRSGKMKEAIAVLSLIIADDAENLEAIDLLQEAVMGTSTEAASATVALLQQAVYANPASTALADIFAEMLARNGRYSDGAAVFVRSAERLENVPEASASLYVALGEFQVRHRREADAIDSYNKAIDIVEEVDGIDAIRDRQFLENVFDKMIAVYRTTNQINKAIEAVERVDRFLGQGDMYAARHMITLYRESGRTADALRAVRASREKTPEDQGLMRLEATILSESGQVEKAVEIVRKGISAEVPIGRPTRDDFSDQLFIAELYTRASRHKDAADAAEESYKLARGNEQRRQIAKLTLATAQHLAGDHAAAEGTLREILKQSPGNPIALNNLGYFLVERNERLEEAAQMIRQALAIDPTNPSYLDSLGWAYFKLGKYGEAEKYLRDAVRYDSGSATIQEHLGDVFAKQGKTDLARMAWERALTLSSAEEDIKRLRGKLQR